ncbi:variant surface glycoprotein VSG [Trypanosoma brucei equiperdum]|uniref:Variant surface glycoprotein VSG n=1 Tax=Trypanosoma brucei equiperdum TaxID=630700 RepID=A0A3L6KRD7_9TRYP|nr:variant surface glycoprotein VSG [Trypanosoma brucei equiperdum]
MSTAFLGKKDGKLGVDLVEAEAILNGGTGNANRGTCCKNINVANNTGKNLATVALCACANMVSGTAMQDTCRSETAADAAYPTNAGEVPTKIQDLIKMCGAQQPTKLTAAAVEQALTTIASSVTITATGAYIGEFLAKGCKGAQDGSVCFWYSTLKQRQKQI